MKRLFLILILLSTPVWADNEVTTDGRTGKGHVIYDESTKIKQREGLSFAGSAVSVADTSGKTVVTISEAGDIESVTAGDGLTGGGTSGAVTLNVGEGLAIDAAADSIAFDPTEFNSDRTWSDGATSVIWTWAVTGNDVTQTFDNGTMTVGGDLGATGNVTGSNLSGTNTGDIDWSSIPDATGIGSIDFAGFDQTITSSEDGGNILTIRNTDADRASDTTMLLLEDYDERDPQAYFIKATGDSDGTPYTAFAVRQNTSAGANLYLGNVTSDHTVLEVESGQSNKYSVVRMSTSGDDWEFSAGGSTVSDTPNKASIWNKTENASNTQEWDGVTSAVNYIGVVNAVTTASPSIYAVGSDTNIGITLTPKGTGVVSIAAAIATTPSADDNDTSVATTAFVQTELTGGLVLVENASIGLDPAGSADGKYTGITVTGTGGATIAFGDLVTLDKDDSRWELVDISVAAAATGDSRGIFGMAVTSSTDGGALTVLLHGIIRADANFPALTIGAPVYASTTGDIVVAQPTTTDHVIRIIGSALTADEIYFNPDNTWTTHT